jgi:hypothetical protein
MLSLSIQPLAARFAAQGGEWLGLNEAIRATITVLFGTAESLAALYTYAILPTALAIIVLVLLSRAAARIGGEAAFEREAEG